MEESKHHHRQKMLFVESNNYRDVFFRHVGSTIYQRRGVLVRARTGTRPCFRAWTLAELGWQVWYWVGWLNWLIYYVVNWFMGPFMHSQRQRGNASVSLTTATSSNWKSGGRWIINIPPPPLLTSTPFTPSFLPNPSKQHFTHAHAIICWLGSAFSGSGQQTSYFLKIYQWTP